MTEKRKDAPVHFHPAQIEYLEKVFPARIFPSTVTENELRFYNAQQSVLEFIRSKCAK